MWTAILDGLIGLGKLLTRELGEHRKDWGRFAWNEPGPAAEAMDRVAVDLEARVAGMKPRRRERMIGRHLTARAQAYRLHAEDLRDRAADRMCPRDPLRKPAGL